MTLAEAKAKSTVTISKVTGDKSVKRHLMELGFLPDREIYVRKVAPLGDPIEVTVKNTELTIRKSDAINILILEA